MPARKEEYERLARAPLKQREEAELLIANATNEKKRRRLSDIKAFLKAQHIELTQYDESLVNRLIDEVRVREECLEMKLKTGQMFVVEK